MILPTGLQDQEVRIVLQNLLARDDLVYDKWDALPSFKLSDDVKDSWDSFSYSLWRYCTVRTLYWLDVIISLVIHVIFLDHILCRATLMTK